LSKQLLLIDNNTDELKKQKYNKRCRIRYHNNLEKERLRGRTKYWKYRDKNRKYYVEYYIRVKTKLMNVIGGLKCVYCGESDFNKLQIDHINGDGKEDRRIFGRGNTRFYTYHINNPLEARKKLQTCCKDCNALKHRLTHDEFLLILKYRKDRINQFC